MIADTNIVIDSIVSSMEFPPVLESELFEGEVYTLTSEDQVQAVKLQKKLRSEGKAVPAPDLLVAAVAINRGEKVVTNDEDFKQISSISELEIEKS